MARPDCPRCGSDLIVAAPSAAPSELVLELRGGNVPIARRDRSVHWLCRSCGHRWDPGADPDPFVWETREASDPAADPARQVAVPEPPRNADEPVEERTPPGRTLRAARDEAGKTLAEAAAATGVWERHLRALEDDAPIEGFPAPAYARLYLREYAGFLDLDPGPLLRDLEALHPSVEEPTFEPLPEARGRGGILAGVLAVLSVVALIVFALSRTGSSPAGEPNASAGVTPVTVRDPDRPPSGAPATSRPPGVRAVLRLSQPSWVQVTADGEVVAAATLQPGEAIAYRARKRLQLTLGNAGAVRLRVNGARVETGAPGEVVSVDLRWREGTLSTTRA